MADPKKIQPKTAQVEVKSGWFSNKVVVTALRGDGQRIELCEFNPLLREEHAKIIAEEAAKAIRSL